MNLVRIFVTHVFIILIAAEGQAADVVLRRTTLLVQDAQKSKQFYEALGFREWLDWSETSDPDSLTGLPLNAKPTHSRIIIMAGKDPYIAMIGLLEYSGPPLTAVRRADPTLGLRDIVLVLETTDFDSVKGRVAAIGAKIIRQPKPYLSNGPSGRKSGIDMLLEDPDGYVVEVSHVLSRAAAN